MQDNEKPTRRLTNSLKLCVVEEALSWEGLRAAILLSEVASGRRAQRLGYKLKPSVS